MMNYFKKLVSSLFFITTSFVIHGKTWNIDNIIRNNENSFDKAMRFLMKDNSVKSGDVIFLGAKEYQLEGRLNVTKELDFIGKGEYKTVIWKSKASGEDYLINCASKNITFKNLSINGGNEDSKIIIINNESITFDKVRFMNGNIAIYSDTNMGGLKVYNCHFTKTIIFRGIEWNRKWSKTKVYNMKQIHIKGSLFEGKQPNKGAEKFAISMDAGNEDRNKGAENIITNLNNMIIEKNTFREDFGGGIALAQVKNVIINNTNIFESGNEQYNNAIHLEDRASNIVIDNNIFKCSKDKKEGKPLLFLGTSERRKFEDGCRNIKIRGNIFKGKFKSKGKCNRILESEGANNILVLSNKTCDMNTFKSPKFSFFNKNEKITIPTSGGGNKNHCIDHNIQNSKIDVYKFGVDDKFEKQNLRMVTFVQDRTLEFINLNLEKKYLIDVFDSSGRLVSKEKLYGSNKIQLKQISKGFHLVRVKQLDKNVKETIFKIFLK